MIQMLPPTIVMWSKQMQKKMEFSLSKEFCIWNMKEPDTIFYSKYVYFNIVWFQKIGEVPVNHFPPLKFQGNAVCQFSSSSLSFIHIKLIIWI